MDVRQYFGSRKASLFRLKSSSNWLTPQLKTLIMELNIVLIYPNYRGMVERICSHPR